MVTFNIAWPVLFSIMRGTQPEGDPVYECMDCGARPSDPDGRLCECGGYLTNISVSREM